MTRLKSLMIFSVLTISVIAPAALFGNEGLFFDGADLMSQGKYDAAVKAFEKVCDQQPGIWIFQLDRAIALMMANRGDEAGAALEAAKKYNRDAAEIQLWSCVWTILFRPANVPPDAKHAPLHQEPVIDDVMMVAAGYQNAKDIAEKSQYLEMIRAYAREYCARQYTTAGPDAKLQRAALLDEAGRYRECIQLVDWARPLPTERLDGALIAHSAHSRLSLGDFGAARAEFTTALRDYPTNVSYFIGRARCEVAMGSLADARADLACARELNLADVEKFAGDVSGAVGSSAAVKASAESSAALMTELSEAIATGKDQAAVVSIALRVQRAHLREQFIPEERYTREYCRLRHQLDLDPQNISKKLALAAFLLRPTVERSVIIDGKPWLATVPCGRPERDVAGHLLAEVLTADPKNIPALQQSAYLLAVRGRLPQMIEIINQAIDLGGVNLDVAVLCLNYYTSIADQDFNKAKKLRVKWSSVSEYREGNVVHHRTTWHVPTQEDLAEADRLDAESRDFRVRAHKPLQQFLDATQNSTDTTTKAQNEVAWAHHSDWLGENQKAIRSAEAAQQVQPFNLDALDYLIALCAKDGDAELGQKFRDFKDSLTSLSPNATLRVFQADLKAGNDAAAQADLEQAAKIDPASEALQLARLDLAMHRKNAGEIDAQVRLICAMEEGRLCLIGRTLDPAAPGFICPDDVRVSLVAHVVQARFFDDAGDTARALAADEQAIALTRRVPTSAMTPPSEKHRYEAPLCCQPNLGPEARTFDFRADLHELHRDCAVKLLALHDERAALPHCEAMLCLHTGANADTAAGQIGQMICQKLGTDALGCFAPR